MPSVTIITFDDRGRVLLARHADAVVWVAPGGSVDPHESPADAAVREMWEETGLRVEPTRVVVVCLEWQGIRWPTQPGTFALTDKEAGIR